MRICHIQKPSLCIVAQGEKIVMLGSESYRYGVFDYLAQINKNLARINSFFMFFYFHPLGEKREGV